MEQCLDRTMYSVGYPIVDMTIIQSAMQKEQAVNLGPNVEREFIPSSEIWNEFMLVLSSEHSLREGRN